MFPYDSERYPSMTFKQRTICRLSDCVLTAVGRNPIAVVNGEFIDQQQFHVDVCQLAASLSKSSNDNFAVYYEEAYPFSISLFALLHCQKKVLIAANNKAVTAEQLIGQGYELLGDWEGNETSVEVNESSDFVLTALDLDQATITLFTSGSSGEPKEINKTLQQFQNEIEVLERYWGEELGDAQVLATVSHQHIYGLLFGVLWPLSAGRCFHNEIFLSPEPLLKKAEGISAYWVASPAQLKRLDDLTPWLAISKLMVIFSSGGALAFKEASQIFQYSQHKVLEIYGSSETGGIAWRKSVDNTLWTTFSGINISVDKTGQSYLSSPYLTENSAYKMDDKIRLQGKHQFELLGRVDRIVKVEEKRLSLDELEQALNNLEWVNLSHTLLVAGKRDKVAAVLVLTSSGEEYLQQQGRAALIKQLRKQLMTRFESVTLPKKWLFMQSLQMNSQGKINQILLRQILSLDSLKYPKILSCSFQDQTVELQCQVHSSLIYFSGHFLDQPILPGVTQLAWVEQFAKIFFPIHQPFLRMEVIKFKKIIQPEDVIKIKLIWKTENNKLYFKMNSALDEHSAGRLVYGVDP